MNTVKSNKKSWKKEIKLLLYFVALVILLSFLSDFISHRYSKEDVDHQIGLIDYIMKETGLQAADITQVSEFPWSTDAVRQFHVKTSDDTHIPVVIYEKSMLFSKYRLTLQKNEPEYQTAYFPPSWGYLYVPEYLPYGYYPESIDYNEETSQILYKEKAYQLMLIQKNKIDEQTVLASGYSTLEEMVAAYFELSSQEGLQVEELEINGLPAYYIEKDHMNSLSFQNGDYSFQLISNNREPLAAIAENMVKLKKIISAPIDSKQKILPSSAKKI